MTAGAWAFALLLAFFFLLLMPLWPYSTSWGYYPAGGVAIFTIVFIVLVLTGAFAKLSEKTDPRDPRA